MGGGGGDADHLAPFHAIDRRRPGSLYTPRPSSDLTRPYTPKTNGKLRAHPNCTSQWAYAHAYQNWDQRTAELSDWLHRYDWHRPHGSLKADRPSVASVYPGTTC